MYPNPMVTGDPTSNLGTIWHQATCIGLKTDSPLIFPFVTDLTDYYWRDGTTYDPFVFNFWATRGNEGTYIDSMTGMLETVPQDCAVLTFGGGWNDMTCSWVSLFSVLVKRPTAASAKRRLQVAGYLPLSIILLSTTRSR